MSDRTTSCHEWLSLLGAHPERLEHVRAVKDIGSKFVYYPAKAKDSIRMDVAIWDV
jgi:hypothetical protein